MERKRISWDFLRHRMQERKILPVIGDRIGHNNFLTSQELIEKWAKSINYPKGNKLDLTRIAQYHAIIKEERFETNSKFLTFLKEALWEKAINEKKIPEDLIKDIEKIKITKSFSEFAERIGFPDFKKEPLNPLSILAKFQIPIFITTSYHQLMARAIREMSNDSKEPYIDYCQWHENRPQKSPIADIDIYKDIDKPLIYHMHGIDTKPYSLVFSEDDYLDFLVRTTKRHDLIPHQVHSALADSSLLLLGYNLDDWDFRVLFQGLIRNNTHERRKKSVCIQLDPRATGNTDPEKTEKYLERYFGKYKFEIYWGTIEEFSQDMLDHLGDE